MLVPLFDFSKVVCCVSKSYFFSCNKKIYDFCSLRETKWHPESFGSCPGNAGLQLLGEQPGSVDPFKGSDPKASKSVCVGF